MFGSILICLYCLCCMLCLQLLVGMHVRGSLVVAVMTWFSLYVGWGTYMMIGTVPTNYNR